MLETASRLPHNCFFLPSPCPSPNISEQSCLLSSNLTTIQQTPMANLVDSWHCAKHWVRYLDKIVCQNLLQRRKLSFKVAKWDSKQVWSNLKVHDLSTRLLSFLEAQKHKTWSLIQWAHRQKPIQCGKMEKWKEFISDRHCLDLPEDKETGHHKEKASVEDNSKTYVLSLGKCFWILALMV